MLLAVMMLLSVLPLTASAEEAYTEGVTTIASADSPTGYIARFVYKSATADSVQIQSNLMYFASEDGSVKNIHPKDWEIGMYPSGTSNFRETLTKVGDDLWVLDLPLPSGAFSYRYVVTENGTSTTYLDPANMPLIHPNGSKANYSMVYMPFDAEKQVENRSYTHPRTDGQTGQIVYDTYMDGENQRALVLYLPYGYDADRAEGYKVVYISHGGGGMEIDWMNDGCVPNIMDNLVAEGKTEPAIVVSMNNSVYSWNADAIIANQTNNIMPFVEAKYNVSTDPADRAYCGLSMGGITTSNMYNAKADAYNYFGVWSAANASLQLEKDGMDRPNLMLSAGNIDFGRTSVLSLKNNLDAAGIENEYFEVKGGHEWNTWQTIFHMFAKDTLWRDEFDIVTEVTEYGQAVTGLILDTKTIVDAGAVNVDTFSVSAITTNPVNLRETFNGQRKVTKAYVSNTPELNNPADSGRYIILELEWGFTVAGSTALVYQSSNYRLYLDYTVTQNEAVNGKSFKFQQDDQIDQVVDDFEYITYDSMFLRMYTPDEEAAGAPLPMVIWNHGAGETYRSGTNANGPYNAEASQILANMGGVGWVANNDKYPAYVLAPQRGTGTGYSRTKVIAFVNELIAAGKVDGNRVYVAGCSAGGAETLNYLADYPEFFAAAIPICPAGSPTAVQLERYKDVPMWFVHAENDRTVQISRTDNTVNLLNTLNPFEVKYTRYDRVFGTLEDPYPDGHWSWVMPLNNDYVEAEGTNYFDWLFAQSRTKINASTAQAETNGEITIQVSTTHDVLGFFLQNENGKAIAITSAAKTVGAGGRLDWTIKTKVGTAGDRVLKLYAASTSNGVMTPVEIPIQIVNPANAYEVVSAKFVDKAVLKNAPTNVTVVTGGKVSKINIQNTNNMNMGKTLVSKTANADGTITWVYSMAIGTAGMKREFNVLAANADGVYASSKTISIAVI